jgi:Domain of unknown function (DUF4440)
MSHLSTPEEFTRQVIVELEARLRSAQLAGDVIALDGLIDDKLLFTGPLGQLLSKQEDLDSHRSGAVRFLQHHPMELSLHEPAAGVVVTNVLARLELEVSGTTVVGLFRYTRVWARGTGNEWRVVAGHTSAVPT